MAVPAPAWVWDEQVAAHETQCFLHQPGLALISEAAVGHGAPGQFFIALKRLGSSGADDAHPGRNLSQQAFVAHRVGGLVGIHGNNGGLYAKMAQVLHELQTALHPRSARWWPVIRDNQKAQRKGRWHGNEEQKAGREGTPAAGFRPFMVTFEVQFQPDSGCLIH